ncbi:uncharacterized protein LOC106133222 [Amyelois transitella]|uniref:uncharacterized protein LOC106133222 n=1 Tax=Amyelois transitella TaxID=680683 RepID=UPI00298F406D|nr:uncharacterized protein LOC106133222 [Amyelois transitella]
MEDFDVFTDEIKFTKPLLKNILNKYVNDAPATPSGPNYQSGRKLLGEECLSNGDELGCAFQFSEAVSASLRTMAVYRDEQMRIAGNQNQKITNYIKPVQEIIDSTTISKDDEKLIGLLSTNTTEITEKLNSFKLDEEPFHKKYLRFGPHNNAENLMKIMKELPKEWTIIQLTAPYNPNENLKTLDEFKLEINSIYLTMYTNDYLGDHVPLTVNIPANVNKVGEKPLFTELYSLLSDNYETINDAQFLNNKRLVQNYWSRREDIDLRMKSVIMVMDKEWLGGWGSLLTGKLVEDGLRDKIVTLVDTTIQDWGFIKLNTKQKILLYNLIESSPVLSSHQLKSCIRRILTEHGNTEEIRSVLNPCQECSKDFRFLNELCLKCLSKAFESIHHFSLVDGIKAFSQAASMVKDGDEWSSLKKAKRHPVILIVDEMLDTFPWETLPILNHHPVSRMENVHFIYNLYKIHEKRFVDGYFVGSTEVGRYVINPEKNLDRMEKRMVSFVQYWCGGWSGYIGEPPPPDCFLRFLSEADVFLYCGHGDGCQLGAGGANGAGVEGAAGMRAATLLSGCGSVRLTGSAGRAPPAASHHHLHVAGSPMVVGMLWEVTDLEVDKVVSSLLALFVPSRARPWPAVGKARWSQGLLDTEVEDKVPFTPERDLLRAVCRARGSTSFVMIASSMVARGLPVRIPDA